MNRPSLLAARDPWLVSRRSFLSVSSLLLTPALARADVIRADYPMHEPELVQEVVVVSHGNVARVKELVGRQPALAKASYDWGFGDWETCIDAASHVGNREIAEFLIANGARPTIFTAAMLGQLDAVKALVAAAPGIQRTPGPHSITLLRHAMAGGPRAQAVVEYLKSIEGADERPSEKPLTPEDVKKLTGLYTYGVVTYSRFEVTANATGQLSIGRPGRFARGLTHLGANEFVPAGSEHVRIRFMETATGMTLTVHDPDVVLTAKKAAA
jgi:hypothetical protein